MGRLTRVQYASQNPNKTMTRKERQEKARQRKVYQIEQWIEELRNHLKEGKTYKQACEIMSAETAKAMDNNPQEKQSIIEAWTELFARFFKIAKEVEAEAKKIEEVKP